MERRMLLPNSVQAISGAGNSMAPWVSSTERNPTSHGMLQHRQPAPLMWKNGGGGNSGFRMENMVQASPQPVVMQNSRRSRHFVPMSRKDEYYWVKRRKNNEAARKSREKRKTNDMILAQKVLLLLQENLQLKKDLLAIRMKYNEIEKDEVDEFRRALSQGDVLSGLAQNLNLADYGIPDTVVKALSNGMDLSLPHFSTTQNSHSMSPPPPSPHQEKSTLVGHAGDSYKCYPQENNVRFPLFSVYSTQASTPNIPAECYVSQIQHPNVQGTGCSNNDAAIRGNSKAEKLPYYTAHTIHPNIPQMNGERNDSLTEPKKKQSRLDADAMEYGVESMTETENVIKKEVESAARKAKKIEKIADKVTLSPNSLMEAAMFQNFIHSSWQMASLHRIHSSSSDEAYSSSSSQQNSSRSGRSWSPNSEESRVAQDSQFFSMSSNKYDNKAGSSSTTSEESSKLTEHDDYSSDMGSGSWQCPSSPKDSLSPDDSNEGASSSDEKSCRLPYKLRFKLAGMQS